MNTTRLAPVLGAWLTLLLTALCAGGAAAAGIDRTGTAALQLRIPGWKHAGAPYRYVPANLYTYINGAADFFIAYGFRQLDGIQYGPADGGADAVTVDIYDMAGKLNAFGVFQSRRDPGAPLLSIGAAAYGSEDYLVFYKDRFYVEIQRVQAGGSDKAVMEQFACSVAEHLPGTTDAPAELGCFSPHGRIGGSERYVRGGILGHAFLDSGILCDYRIGDEQVTAFIAYFPSALDARRAGEQHQAYLRAEGKPCSVVEGLGDGGFVSEEPYHNKIIAACSGSFVAGVYNGESIQPAAALLKDILSRLSTNCSHAGGSAPVSTPSALP